MDKIWAAIGGFVRDYWEVAAGLVAIVGAILLALRFIDSFWRSYRLLRLYHAGDWRGWPVIALMTCLKIVLGAPLTIVTSRSLFNRVRMRLEYEALNARPGPEDSADERRAWFEGRRRLFARGASELIQVETPQILQERFDDVGRYFSSLERVGLERSELRFETKVKIKRGFVAPLHLAAGLSRKFEDEWGEILRAYNQDRWDFSEILNERTHKALARLREIQLFIFDCWLLWGPSIPICHQHCLQFHGSWSSLQYGFGDENNSVEIVGDSAYLTQQWNSFEVPAGVKAVSAEVTGHLANSRFINEEDAAHRIGPAIATSWNSDEDGKLLLLMSEEAHQRSAEEAGHVVKELALTQTGDIKPTREGDSYYSAYLWAIFVVLREEPGAKTASERAWIPVHPMPGYPRASAKPWLDLFTFFEHGNIADKQTFAFLKGQLAEKSVGGLARLVAEMGDESEYPLRFAFACSIDESGCGNALRFHEAGVEKGPSGFARDTLPDLMWRHVQEKFPHLSETILFDYYDASVHPHSACSLPDGISQYFTHIGKVPA
jgi:hypothetical protein